MRNPFSGYPHPTPETGITGSRTRFQGTLTLPLKAGIWHLTPASVSRGGGGQSTVYPIHYTVSSIQSAVYSQQYTVSSIPNTLYIIHYTGKALNFRGGAGQGEVKRLKPHFVQDLRQPVFGYCNTTHQRCNLSASQLSIYFSSNSCILIG
jgi:hypothetical protein